MDFTEKNNFVIAHASAVWFEADRAIFMKLFPESKLIADLKRANQFTHKKLDERMLLEILNVKDGDFVLKHRKAARKLAQKKDSPKTSNPAKKAPGKSAEKKANPTTAKKKPTRKATKKKADRA